MQQVLQAAHLKAILHVIVQLTGLSCKGVSATESPQGSHINMTAPNQGHGCEWIGYSRSPGAAFIRVCVRGTPMPMHLVQGYTGRLAKHLST